MENAALPSGLQRMTFGEEFNEKWTLWTAQWPVALNLWREVNKMMGNMALTYGLQTAAVGEEST